MHQRASGTAVCAQDRPAIRTARAWAPSPSPIPETERLAARLMTLPTGTAVDGPTVDAVCALVAEACAQGAAAERALGESRASA